MKRLSLIHIFAVSNQNSMRITTGMLNNILEAVSYTHLTGQARHLAVFEALEADDFQHLGHAFVDLILLDPVSYTHLAGTG